MPEIIPNQDFKHGRETYEKGKPYEVSEGEAYYFTANGWVGDAGASGSQQDLEIHDSTLGHTAEVK